MKHIVEQSVCLFGCSCRESGSDAQEAEAKDADGGCGEGQRLWPWRSPHCPDGGTLRIYLGVCHSHRGGGAKLRQAGIRRPILVLGYTFQEDDERLVREEIRQLL